MGPVTNLHGVQLPEHYEIRPLDLQYREWVAAIIAHGNIYQGWLGALYEGQRAKTALGFWRIFRTGYERSLEGNLCYGVFDKDYQFKRPESAATGGALYWSEFNQNDPDLELDGRQKLSDAMDFPLVSVAMAHDAHDQECATLLFGPLTKEFPAMASVFGAAPPDMPAQKAEEGPTRGSVVGRNGTATADAYTGKGLMKALSHFLMHETKANGYNQIRLGNTSMAVHHVWSNPPAPYKASVLMDYHCQDHEVEINGEKVKMFEKCRDPFRGTVYVQLSE